MFENIEIYSLGLGMMIGIVLTVILHTFIRSKKVEVPMVLEKLESMHKSMEEAHKDAEYLHKTFKKILKK